MICIKIQKDRQHLIISIKFLDKSTDKSTSLIKKLMKLLALRLYTPHNVRVCAK